MILRIDAILARNLPDAVTYENFAADFGPNMGLRSGIENQMAAKEASARIKISKLLELAGWRFSAEGNKPANIRLEPTVTIKSTDLDALGRELREDNHRLYRFSSSQRENLNHDKKNGNGISIRSGLGRRQRAATRN